MLACPRPRQCVDKALVSRQSWSWTTLPRKPVYVKATKFTSCPFSFLFLSCESEADFRFMLQDSFSTLTEHSEGVDSATRAPISLFRGYVILSAFGTEAWILLGIPMMLPVCLSVALRTLLINSLFCSDWSEWPLEVPSISTAQKVSGGISTHVRNCVRYSDGV